MSNKKQTSGRMRAICFGVAVAGIFGLLAAFAYFSGAEAEEQVREEGNIQAEDVIKAERKEVPVAGTPAPSGVATEETESEDSQNATGKTSDQEMSNEEDQTELAGERTDLKPSGGTQESSTETPRVSQEPSGQPVTETVPEHQPAVKEEQTEIPKESTGPDVHLEEPKGAEEHVHSWLFESYFQEPTCSNGGLVNQICAHCGKTQTAPGTPTGKHIYATESPGDCCSAEIVVCTQCNQREIRGYRLDVHIDVEEGFCYGCGQEVD